MSLVNNELSWPFFKLIRRFSKAQNAVKYPNPSDFKRDLGSHHLCLESSLREFPVLKWSVLKLQLI